MLPVLAWLRVGVSKIKLLFFNLFSSFKLLQLFLDFNFRGFCFLCYAVLSNGFYMWNAGMRV